MAETDKHIDLILGSRNSLRLHYAPRATSVYVSGNNFIYYEEGNPRARVSPDGYVIFGVEQRSRDSYKAWEEGGHLPAIVFEFTSKSTRNEDTTRKFHLYEQILKIPEYILFDPTGDYIPLRLRGLRLVNGVYVEIPMTNGRWYSEQLGLEFAPDGVRLRFFDPVQNRFLPTLEESEARFIAEQIAWQEAEAQIAIEQAARQEAESEAERLRAEVEALRRQLAEKEA